MANLFRFYHDAGLTNPVVSPLEFTIPVDHSSDPPDQVIFFGCPQQSPRILARAVSSPGVDVLQAEVIDASPGSGHEATAATFSDTADFTGKVAGDPLSLGVEVLDGSANAKPVHVRFRDFTSVQGNSVEISIGVLGIAEYDQ